MKTAISIPDDLHRQADELAARLGMSRSQLYREALTDYVLRRSPAAVTRALDERATVADPDDDAFVTAAATRVLLRSEW